MKLVIKSFAVSDVGTYHCVSTNSLGKAEGTIRVYGKFQGKLNYAFCFKVKHFYFCDFIARRGAIFQ